MSGIGDQTLNITKGLKVISSNITIGTTPSTLKPVFVKLCKQKNTPGRLRLRIRGNHIVRSGKTEQPLSHKGKNVKGVH